MVEWCLHYGDTEMKIEFYSTVPGVADTFPVQEAKECIPSWMSLARQEYLKDKSEINVFRCPGIVDLLTTGFIVSAWHDIELGQLQDGHLHGRCPSAELENLLGYPPVQVQGGDSIGKHLPKRPWSHQDILKINTPWCVNVPKGVKLMILPISYTDNLQFESTIGILDPAISNDINIQGYINALGPIKAGTPIAHIVPMTERKYNLVVREMNAKDKIWQAKKKFFNNFSFILNRSKIKQAYESHNESKCPFHRK